MKILRVEFKNLPLFKDGDFHIDFFATDRVLEENRLFNLHGSTFTQNVIALSGINATGKTTALRYLGLAMALFIGNKSLNEVKNIIPTGMLEAGTIMLITFYSGETYYQLESHIGWRSPEKYSGANFFYEDEILRSKPQSSVKTKKDILNFSGRTTKEEVRSKLDKKASAYLRDDLSFVYKLTNGVNFTVINTIEESNFNLFQVTGKIPPETLQVFDDNIDYLQSNLPQGNVPSRYNLKFKNTGTTISTDNPFSLTMRLSSGTVKGSNLLCNAIKVLKNGGLLLVDEIENHFNKELVKLFLDLFGTPRTNPYGACLVFSTHYTELLDFLERKDNIYLFKKANGLLSVSKFSDEFTRNDVKKSDVLFSNYLKGTAPSYENIEKLKVFVCKEISNH